MASSSSDKKKVIVLVSSDGQSFEVAEATALMSQTVKNIIEDDCAEGEIPLPNVHSTALAKVIEFCNRHAASDAAERSNDEESLKDYDSKLVDSAKNDQDMLFDLILAANYLDINILLDLMCRTVADMMRGKTPEQIRTIFHIKNDYTKEEMEEIKRENAWAFE